MIPCFSCSFRHPHLPLQRLILLRCCPRMTRSWIVALGQSTKHQVNRQSKDDVPCPEDNCSTRGPSVQLDLSFSAAYLLVNLHCMFYYRSRQGLAQICTSSGKRWRIQPRHRRPRRFGWDLEEPMFGCWDNFMNSVVVPEEWKNLWGCAREMF